MQLDGQARAADLVEQRVEAVEAGLRQELGLVPFAAHGGQETAHLGERGPAGSLDALERIAVLGRRIGEVVPDGADLEHHHADGVGDDVVELAGDPRALLCHRDACCRLTLALGVGRAFFRRFRLLRTFTQGVARDPGDHEPEGNEDEIAGCLRTGDVGDHDHDPDQNDDQTRTRLHGLPQVPEQERGCQPDDAEAADERDQKAVDERERRGQDPVVTGAAKGKRRRANSGSTRTATAGTVNHSVKGGAPGASRPTTSSSIPAIARNATRSSNQYSRATGPIRLTR